MDLPGIDPAISRPLVERGAEALLSKPRPDDPHSGEWWGVHVYTSGVGVV